MLKVGIKMNITTKVKYLIKKFLSPATQTIRRIARNVAIEENSKNTSQITDQINTLQKELDSFRKSNASFYQQIANEINDLESNSNYIYYYHGGSGNHGCEALVRTITKLCDIKKNALGLYSYRSKQDREFGILNLVSFIKQSNLDATEIPEYVSPNTIALSIGGDNYCGYPIPQLAKYNRKFHAQGAKTALVGCSIEPSNLEHGEILGDLCQFDLITARETITYNALIEKGIVKNTHLVPDSAFSLEKTPSGIKLPNNTIGINLSNITIYSTNNLILENSKELINYILSNTKYNIALIPHVHQDFNDDYNVLNQVYTYFNKNSRIQLIDTNYNACELKDIISQCKLLIASRTHCSIAGYSSNVPTLVLGYSVKSIGIARDIFDTEQNYVKSIYDFKNKNELKEAFIWLEKNQDSIRKHLTSFMPKYIEKTKTIKKYINNLTIESNSKPKIEIPKEAKIGHYKKGVLSIITSCYNSSLYIHRYLDSILNQTNHNIQLIIINDGSTDKTEDIILNYKPILEKQNIEVIYIKQQNSGIGAAYNKALKYISGEYFCWCDSDNFYSPNFVEKVLNYFYNHPNAKILRHDGYFVSEENTEDINIFNNTSFKKFSIDSPNPTEKNLFMNAILEKNWHFGNIVLSTPAFDSITERTIYPSRVGQNWQICLPMLYNFEAHYIPDVLFYFVVRDSSVSHQVLIKDNNFFLFHQFDEYEKILYETLQKMNIPNKKTLLKIIEQKYICLKLNYAKNLNNQNEIDIYTKLFNEKVKPNNLYERALNNIK